MNTHETNVQAQTETEAGGCCGGGSQQAKHHEHVHDRAQRDQATGKTPQTAADSPTAPVQKPTGKSGCCCS